MAKHASGPSAYEAEILAKAEAYLQQCHATFDEQGRPKATRESEITKSRSRSIMFLAACFDEVAGKIGQNQCRTMSAAIV